MNDFPKRVTVEMTNDCNLNCFMCPRRFMTDAIGYMETDLWKKIIDEIADKDITLVPFWRGCSLLHPNVDSMMAYTIGKFKQIQFATNGILVKQHLDLLLSFDFVSVSYHTHHAVEAIKLLSKHRKNKKPTLQVSVVTGEKTETKIDDLKKYVDVIRVYSQHTEDGNFGSIGGRNGRTFCSKLVNDITIAYNGNISRCCHSWRIQDPINVREASIAEVWNGDIYKKIRSNYPDNVCIACDQWDSITVGKVKKVTT